MSSRQQERNETSDPQAAVSAAGRSRSWTPFSDRLITRSYLFQLQIGWLQPRTRDGHVPDRMPEKPQPDLTFSCRPSKTILGCAASLRKPQVLPDTALAIEHTRPALSQPTTDDDRRRNLIAAAGLESSYHCEADFRCETIDCFGVENEYPKAPDSASCFYLGCDFRGCSRSFLCELSSPNFESLQGSGLTARIFLPE